MGPVFTNVGEYKKKEEFTVQVLLFGVVQFAHGTVRLLFRNDRKDAFLQFLSHKIQFGTRT